MKDEPLGDDSDEGMVSKRIAQASVVLFAMVFVPSVAVVLHGSQHPSYYRPIQRGEVLPAIALLNTDGRTVRLRASANSHLMLVGAPSLDLTEAQRDWVARLASRVGAAVPVKTVVVTNEHRPTTPVCEVCPTASSLLIDEDRALMPILGGNAVEARVCIIDGGGRVVFNAPIPHADEMGIEQAEFSETDLLQVVGPARVIAHR